MKLAVITCYDQQDYIRGRVIRTALQTLPAVELLTIHNTQSGLLRYIEVSLKIVKARLVDKPDAYLINFRGYEMMLLLAYSFVRKPIIFDELINFTEWMEEHNVIKPHTLRYRLFRWWYASWAGRARVLLADTDAHAAYSAGLNKLSLGQYCVLPVGTNESVFYPRTVVRQPRTPFTVFYYGHMLPLHGLKYVLAAAELLRDNPNIKFQFVGGKQATVKLIAAAIASGARVIYKDWLPFDELPVAASQAGLCLGGPFGATTQSQYVITGKTYQFLALGVPVLIGQTQVGEMFQDKVNCLLVPQADAQAIADSIDWAYHHPDELKVIAQAGRELYQQHFSQAHITALVSDLLSSLQSS
jgi:glycosyltransferase involved in cell wall biosynthesis